MYDQNYGQTWFHCEVLKSTCEFSMNFFPLLNKGIMQHEPTETCIND